MSMSMPAFAQDGAPKAASESQAFATPTPEQQELNDQAVQALTDENYAKAISYLEEALFIGELNVSYLNLGRAYQQMGECAKAKRALGRVESAPAVEKPPPEFVQKKAAEYMAELPETCPSPESTDASADKAEASDVESPPKWPIAVVSSGVFVMAGGALAMVAANSIRSGAESQAAGAPENGYTQQEFADAEDEANLLGAVGVGAAAVGVLTTGVGVYVLVSERREHAERPTTTFMVGPSTDGAQAGIRIQF